MLRSLLRGLRGCVGHGLLRVGAVKIAEFAAGLPWVSVYFTISAMHPPRHMLCAAVCLSGFAGILHGGAVLKDVDFSHTADVGYGNEVCVLGSHPLLGGNDPLKAVKLVWSTGNVWRGKIALPAGESLAYKFISRPFDAASWTNASTYTNLSGVLNATTPSHVDAPWSGKTVFLHSTWSQAYIQFRDLTAGSGWTQSAMRRVGQGRNDGESLFRIDGVAANGAEMEFVFTDGNNNWLNAPAPPSHTAQGAAPAVPVPYQGLVAPYNFRTRLDVFFVQDQQVFNYKPPASVGAPRTEWRQIGSTVAGIPGRSIGIHLPRGYDTNAWKKFPVLYLHDGQNVFFPGGDFGTWDADRIADYETSQGRMRECIIVAVNNDGGNRLKEYLPDGETLVYSGTTYNGAASKYLQFLLDNVVPTLDYNFRTLGDAANTLTAGSSMGGLVSDYIGHQKSDRFGGLGIFSPAYWAAPVYMGGRTIGMLPLRRYLYMGTAEASAGNASSDIYWQGALDAWNKFMNAGHAANRDLMFEGGAGAPHKEPAWSARLPAFFAFALDPWREANTLALAHFPPTLRLEAGTNSSAATLLRRELFGFRQYLLTGTNLAAWQTNALPASADAWSEAAESVALDSAPKMFWRLQTNPAQ